MPASVVAPVEVELLPADEQTSSDLRSSSRSRGRSRLAKKAPHPKALVKRWAAKQPRTSFKGALFDICSACEQPAGDQGLLRCAGVCLQAFHPACVGLDAWTPNWWCVQCAAGRMRCFACGGFGAALQEGTHTEEGPGAAGAQVKKCCTGSCGRFFHYSCVTQLPLTHISKKGHHFYCPQHYCATCGDSGDGTSMVKCMRCCNAYHCGACLPEDAQRLTSTCKMVLCPEHAGTPAPGYLVPPGSGGHNVVSAGQAPAPAATSAAPSSAASRPLQLPATQQQPRQPHSASLQVSAHDHPYQQVQQPVQHIQQQQQQDQSAGMQAAAHDRAWQEGQQPVQQLQQQQLHDQQHVQQQQQRQQPGLEQIVQTVLQRLGQPEGARHQTEAQHSMQERQQLQNGPLSRSSACAQPARTAKLQLTAKTPLEQDAWSVERMAHEVLLRTGSVRQPASPQASSTTPSQSVEACAPQWSAWGGLHEQGPAGGSMQLTLFGASQPMLGLPHPGADEASQASQEHSILSTQLQQWQSPAGAQAARCPAPRAARGAGAHSISSFPVRSAQHRWHPYGAYARDIERGSLEARVQALRAQSKAQVAAFRAAAAAAAAAAPPSTALTPAPKQEQQTPVLPAICDVPKDDRLDFSTWILDEPAPMAEDTLL